MSELANSYKQQGNAFFAQQRYAEAISAYSQAIDRSGAEYQSPHGCIIYQPSFMLSQGQALGHDKTRLPVAIACLKKAYQLSLSQNTPSTFSSSIVAKILATKKQHWEVQEEQRVLRQSELLQYVKGLVASDFARKRQVLVTGDPTSQGMDEAQQHLLESIDDEKASSIGLVETIFAQANENLARLFGQRRDRQKREVPEYFIDQLSFEIMYDPVITPSGISYERSQLIEHLQKIGNFDPLTRHPMTENDIVPNRALREAAEAFVA
ncbi:hypothetical protein H4R34_001035, partial [Dimargaris verticillata]